MGFLVQAYDKKEVVVGVSVINNPDRAHDTFVKLCCSSDRQVEWVRMFIEGESVPIIYAFRNRSNMWNFINCDVPSRLLH